MGTNFSENSFKQSWSQILAVDSTAVNLDPVWKLLESAYQEPHRQYHNLHHISSCLDWLGFAKQKSILPDTESYLLAEMALWFHDIVYVPQRNDNEEKSSQIFLEIANSVGMHLEVSQRVSQLILLTKYHLGATSLVEQLMLDCDLSILGAPLAQYDRYAANIRQEYSFVAESVYREKRSQILQRLLERSSIFQLHCFQIVLETQARENINRELDRYH